MKDAANVLDNFPLPNGCGATLFYSFCCSVVAAAMPPIHSSPSIKHFDEASCYFFLSFSPVIECWNQSVFCVYSKREAHLLRRLEKFSVIFRMCPAGISRIWKTRSWVRVAFTTWTSCVWGFRGDNQWGIISFTSALTHDSEAQTRCRSVEMGKIHPERARPPLRPSRRTATRHYFSVDVGRCASLLSPSWHGETSTAVQPPPLR